MLPGVHARSSGWLLAVAIVLGCGVLALSFPDRGIRLSSDASATRPLSTAPARPVGLPQVPRHPPSIDVYAADGATMLTGAAAHARPLV